MGIINFNSGMFMANISHIFLNNQYNNNLVNDSISHLKNPMLIIQLTMTVVGNTYNYKVLPTEILYENVFFSSKPQT